jgi:nicotinate-nucleotide adenylyltransferase
MSAAPSAGTPQAGAPRAAAPTERIGILGGTFDPIHIAHLVAAVAVRHALALDRVLLVVAGVPWQKRGTVVAAAADRLAMAEAAVAGLDGIEVSPIEVERTGATYTIDTLRALAAADRELFLIVGTDVAAKLDSWHEADHVRAAATLVVVNRSGAASGAERERDHDHDHETVTIPRLDISSSDVRDRVANGEPIDVLVPAGAVRVIRERRLYTRT